ncbi:hypothetical protein GSY74_02910 [Sulfurovum sp. bin170]|uniref:hypothetical protein n=1 Tax=Sulfurovum sp. bin170 TaxID=2695268 RepID=UPI0013DE7A63|nr:hypothetical protein [Sulfurovum sp. bin170]NEW60223.1 hypothetical protein [Sulfurovum sp. bin170]
MRDFTHDIYIELLNILKDRGFQFITVEEYFTLKYDKNRPFIMLRHDVDRRPNSSLAMAKIENSLGVKATYYFRTIPKTLKADIINGIANLGHEIGYHYESLAETNGDYEKAIVDFEKNLFSLNRFYPIKSISMHGRPTSRWDSRLLWERYDYRRYGISSEPYFDIDFQKILYITDAGRAWNNEAINLRDRVESDFDFLFNHTADIISNIDRGRVPDKIMINIHPEHWADELFEWYRILLIRKIKNFVKKIVIRRKIDNAI